MCRVIEEVRPAWVLGENVPGIVNLALDTVLSDLENIGYTGQAFIIPACGVDAPHKRERVAIVAYTVNGGGALRRDGEFQDSQEDGGEGIDNGGRTAATITRERRQDESRAVGMADGLRTEIHGAAAYSGSVKREWSGGESFLFTNSSSREREPCARVSRKSARACGSHSAWRDWPDESGICRVVDGLPNRMDRIRCLGNAVVPQQFYMFFEAIARIETGGDV